MSITTFSLPIDIPWKRIAFSADMMDKVACDRELPTRWLSSVAVFEYEPPEDQQRTDEFRISYLKVACTITGFQAAGKEIRIRERLGRSGWANKDLTDVLGEITTRYYACYGAILEVVVAPHEDEGAFKLADYPYFADFDPKKRELYEMVSETGETMSRSLEDVGVRQGRTTSQSHEVKDSTTLAGELAGAYGNAMTGGQLSAKGSASNTSGTTDLSHQATENIRTTDASREARETLSHTTQLTQMYHQLNSYHLGTNRAAFFVLPRPHVIQSPSTFVNGPREIEGIQEFMLVVVRPKAMEKYCVEAYLETAHLTGEPITDSGETEVPLRFKVDALPGGPRVTNEESTPPMSGYLIDTDRAPPGAFIAPGSKPHGHTGGYRLNWVNENGSPRLDSSILSDYTFKVDKGTVTVTGWAEGDWVGQGENRRNYPTTLELSATVFLKKSVVNVIAHEPGLMITARAVCSCGISVRDQVVKGPSVVFEKPLPKTSTRERREVRPMSIHEANQLGADLKREMLQSLSSADRYPRGAVGLLDSQLVAGTMGAHLRNADREANMRLSDWAGANERLVRRITAHAPSMTRSQMLEMPLAQQVESFGLTFAEAVELRRGLTDLAEPSGPPPIPEPVQIEIPLLTGLQLREAHAALSEAGLTLGAVSVMDSPLPSHTVVEHRPEAGAKVDRGSKVSVQVASGRSVRLPALIGLGLSEAACRMRDAGLRSEPSIHGQPGPDAKVVAIEPPAGTLVTPNTPVTMTLERRP